MGDLITSIDGGSAVIYRIKCWRQERYREATVYWVKILPEKTRRHDLVGLSHKIIPL